MRDRWRRGFTLVELMAAMTILVLIGLIAGSLTLYVLSGSNSVQRRAESDTEERGLMARIAYDLQTVVHNQNVGLVANPSVSSAISPSIAFVCASRSVACVIGGTTVIPRLSVVYYQIPPSASVVPNPLLRGCGPVFMDPTLSYTPTDPSAALGLAATAMSGGGTSGFSVAPDVVPIGTDVIRITYVLTLLNGNIVPLAPSATGFPVSSTSTAVLPSSSWVAVDLSQVRAITVGIAVLDSGTQRLLSALQLSNLAQAIPEPAAGQKPLDVWSVTNSSIQTGLAGLPAPVQQHIRFYQQTILTP